MSPAYDVTYAYNPNGAFTSKHQMSINRKCEHISEEDFLLLAKRQGLNVSSVKSLINKVKAAIAQWHRFATIAEVDPRKSDAIGGLIC